VDAVDLQELGFQQREAEEGRPSYAADLLLKVWLYGYFHKIRATRPLEKACMNDIGLLWLTGLEKPDHNTLWRFWRDNKKAIRRVFKETLQMAAKAKLTGLILHAVDGTKIETAASKKGAWHCRTSTKSSMS
jgi:transposase